MPSHDHPHPSLGLSDAERYPEIQRVTLLGALINLVLAFSKMVLGWLGQSQALFADGVHSLSDLLTDVLVLFTAKHGSQQADKEHPYGHGRIETLGTLFMGLFLLAVALGLAVDAGHRLFKPEGLYQPTWIALIAVIVSIASKEFLFHYTLALANRLHSQLLRGNAWHHRTDSLSSVIVLVGIGGSLIGMPWLDAVGAIGVTAMIAFIGWELFWQGTRELIDTGLDEAELTPIRQVITSVDGVDQVHDLRTRRMGSAVIMDLHIVVPPIISVSEGHQIGENARYRLHKEHAQISDIIVHIDPEDDENQRKNQALPSRAKLEPILHARWQKIPAVHQIQHIGLHYLAGQIHVEVFLPLSVLSHDSERSALQTKLQQSVADVTEIGRITVYFSV